VFVEVGEIVLRARASQQLFILADQVRQGRLGVRPIGQQHGALDRGQLAGNGLVQLDEVAVDQHQPVFGMIHGVKNLVGREAHVDGMHHRPDHRDGEHTLKVAVAVPVHHCHGVTGLDASFAQHVGQLRDALVQLGVGQPHLVPVDDLTGFFVAAGRHQQALDQQGVGIGVVGGLEETGLQHKYPFY